MSIPKRSLRRHHRERLNNHARFIVTKVWNWARWEEKQILHWVQRSRDNMKRCSCIGCCNQRHQWGKEQLTMQELRHLDSEKAQMDEVFNSIQS